MERDGLIALLEAVAPALSVGSAAMATFRTMASLTRPSDFKRDDTEPCCFSSQTEIAHRRGVDPSRIREHERELEEAGLIQKRTMANGARSGFVGCGIFFSSAIARIDEFRKVHSKSEERRREHAHLRGLRSIHKRHLRDALNFLQSNARTNSQIREIEERYSQWPNAARLHRMSLEQLQDHINEVDELCSKGLDLRENLLKTRGEAIENTPSYIQDTNEDLNIVNCNGEEQNKHRLNPKLTKRFLDTLGPDKLFDLCSEDMQLHLTARKMRFGRLHFHDFIIAAENRVLEIGIHHSAWKEAKFSMGEATAMLCLLIIDSRSENNNLEIMNKGAYLRGMTRVYRQNKLNVIGSLIGLADTLAEKGRIS